MGACTINGKKGDEKLPGIDIPITKLNKKIELEAVPGMPPTNQNGEMLAFLIRNHTSNMVIFTSDFDVKIFKWHDSVWEPITNKMGYPEGDRILTPTNTDPTGLALFVLPDIGEIDELTTVRIVIIGKVKDKSEQVGAYIDVKYAP